MRLWHNEGMDRNSPAIEEERFVMGFWETKEFKALEKHYLDLIAEKFGFDDLESRRDRNSPIRGTPSRKALDETTAEYYEAARALLHELPVDSEVYQVWALHSEGVSIKKIVKTVGISQRKTERLIKETAATIKRKEV